MKKLDYDASPYVYWRDEGACSEARDWLEEGAFDSHDDAWRACPNADWMLWALSHLELRRDRPDCCWEANHGFLKRTPLPDGRVVFDLLPAETQSLVALDRELGRTGRENNVEWKQRAFVLHDMQKELYDTVKSLPPAGMPWAHYWALRAVRALTQSTVACHIFNVSDHCGSAVYAANGDNRDFDKTSAIQADVLRDAFGWDLVTKYLAARRPAKELADE